jgi:hypothetical protein
MCGVRGQSATATPLWILLRWNGAKSWGDETSKAVWRYRFPPQSMGGERDEDVWGGGSVSVDVWSAGAECNGDTALDSSAVEWCEELGR